MKKTVIILFVLAMGFSAQAYDSGIALVTQKGMNMQVYVNGKLYNKNPGTFVRVRSTPGLFKIEVRVMNPQDNKWHTIKKDVRAEKGFELQYKVIFVNAKAELVELKKSPIFSRYFLNPTLYNKHSIS